MTRLEIGNRPQEKNSEAQHHSKLKKTEFESKHQRVCEEGNGNPLQYPFLGNPSVREAQRATVHGITVRHD